jgi:hypothetical protein
VRGVVDGVGTVVVMVVVMRVVVVMDSDDDFGGVDRQELFLSLFTVEGRPLIGHLVKKCN